jgi:hypothetical protein
MLQIGALGPKTVVLSTSPKTLEQARSYLELAIRAADPAPEFAQAVVTLVDDRLLVVPGGSGGQVTFSTEASDPASVYLLGLANRVGVDVVHGRLAFPLGVSPTRVQVSYNYGFSGDLGGGPYDRRETGLGAAAPYENSVAVMELNTSSAMASIRPLLVPDSFPTITAALAAWNPADRLTVIQVNDSRTYVENLTLNMGTGDLVIQGRNKQRPTLIGDITVRGSGKARLQLNGLLVSGAVTVAEDNSLRQLDVVHTTLVAAPRGASVSSNLTNTALQVNLRFSICGPLLLPAESEGLEAQDSILLSSTLGDEYGGEAHAWPALVSDSLSGVFPLSSVTPAVRVYIGNEGPFRAQFSSKPASAATARTRLEQALHAASDSPAFQQLRVLLDGNRLIILPGEMAPVVIENDGPDQTATELGLTPAKARTCFATIGARVDPFSLTALNPAMNVSWMESSGQQTRQVTLSPKPTDLASAQAALESGLQAEAEAILSGASVVLDSANERLVVIPGADISALVFTPLVPGGAATPRELGLESEVYALAGSSAGDQPGPVSHLERCTVLGMTHVLELAYASECLFTDLTTSDRRQGRGERDCVRFCYLLPGSRTPPRYRCQPELAIAGALEAEAQALNRKLLSSEQQAITERILSRLVPTFTSTHYGDPGFAQLGQACPIEIRTGTADGSEMGAFNFLKQPQREANLLSSLDEYLRFGLEAGLFYAS